MLHLVFDRFDHIMIICILFRIPMKGLLSIKSGNLLNMVGACFSVPNSVGNVKWYLVPFLVSALGMMYIMRDLL